MIETVNVVGSGSLGIELDLQEVARDIGPPKAKYDPEKYPGMYIRFEEGMPLCTVYRTGKYIVTGGSDGEIIYSAREELLSLFADIGVLEEAEDDWFNIQNYVCLGSLDQVQNLNALAIGLGLENTEYEPEQFPGLIYRPENHECVLLIFGTGNVVITGAGTMKVAEQAFGDLQELLANFE